MVRSNGPHSWNSPYTAVKSRALLWQINVLVVRMWKRELRTMFLAYDGKGRCSLEGSGIKWRMIRACIVEKCCEDTKWIHVAQDSGQWQAFVITIMNPRGLQQEVFVLAQEECFSTMELRIVTLISSLKH